MKVEEESELLIPFIDENEEHESRIKDTENGQYNLTITRNYQNKTRRVEISKIFQDVESLTNRSLSPVAPLAYESDTDGGKNDLTELTEAEFELTIKSNNSIIKIQGFDNKSMVAFKTCKAKSEKVHDFLSKELDKIFKKPEKDEIDKAMKSIGEKKKLKPICRQKKNNWKTLAKSIVGLRSDRSIQRRESIERYPKMVLLQDPKKSLIDEKESYPKMIVLDKEKENEKNSLKLESEEIERCKMNLNKGKKFLKEEKKMLNKKKDAIQDKKMNLGDDTVDERFLKKEMDVIAEEKLCMELEKRLLGEEKDILREEMDLLKKEKKMLQKEKDLLGVEKKHDDSSRRGTMNTQSTMKRISPQQQLSFDAEELSYSSVPPFYCQFPTHCPFIPMYSNRPYYHYNEVCCGGRTELPIPQKDSSTQTDAEQQIDTDKDMDLPFGILSNLFPRIVVMKSFQEEVTNDDAQIYELPKTETPVNEKEDEKDCTESESVQLIDVELDKESEDVEELKGSAPEKSMPLTKIGYCIYDKLNELAIERKKEAEEATIKKEKIEMMDTKIGKSPRDITLEYGNQVLNFSLGNENLNFEINDGNNEKMVVMKRDLWHPSHEINRRSGDTARGLDQICVSVSDNQSIILTVRVGEERKWTNDAKVGTDGIDIAGGDFVCQEGINMKNLSPRTGKALRSLKDKLGRMNCNKDSIKREEFKFPGLFFIEPFDSRYRGFPSDDYIMTKERERRAREVSTAKPREYYCEECLATMKLIEDENTTVKAMVDKFERIIHLGSY